jgi:mycothiol synthase
LRRAAWAVLRGIVLPVRNFIWDDLPALLELVGKVGGRGNNDQEMQRALRDLLGQPGLTPEEDCILVEQLGQIQGFVLVCPELPIGRAVLDIGASSELISRPLERQMICRAVTRAQEMGAGVVHVCLPQYSPTRSLLEEEGFSYIRTYWEMVWRQTIVPRNPLPDGFKIRHFQAGDAPILAKVQNSCFAESWGFSPNTVMQIEYRTSLASALNQKILFMSHGGLVAGYCWTSISSVDGKPRGIIGMMGVDPIYRGRGLSRSILLAGMEHLRSKGVDDIGLNVDGSNEPAIRLYTSVGFNKASEIHWFEVHVAVSSPRTSDI